MRLVDLVASASEWVDDMTTIYVEEPWTCEADAILVSPAPDTTEPIDRDGRRYSYFLETFIAREVLESVSGSNEKRCERLSTMLRMTPDLRPLTPT